MVVLQWFVCQIDDLNEEIDQVRKFSQVFKSIFDNPNCNKPIYNEFNENFSKQDNDYDFRCSIENIIEGVRKLKPGIGPDNINSQH